jgi:hypothetical protein
MDLGATRVEVFAGGEVTVGGEHIAPPPGMDPYSAAIAVLAEYARSSGAPAIAHAVDHSNGQEGRFQVLADGTAEAVPDASQLLSAEDAPNLSPQTGAPDAPGSSGFGAAPGLPPAREAFPRMEPANAQPDDGGRP